MNKVGIYGEVLAAKYLKKNKYKVLNVNYTNSIGEIDIIARVKDVIVFVEVKARSSMNFGMPRDAVNLKKQNKIRQVATAYLLSKKLLDSKCRFDVIEVLNEKITHIENAF